MASKEQSFGPEKRIKKRAEFLRIQEGGKKKRSNNFLIIAKPNTLGKARVGITISKKVDKRAVERNKIKRRVREIFRRLYPFIQEPSDIVIIAMREAKDLNYLQIKSEINYAFRKLGLLPNRQQSKRNQ